MTIHNRIKEARLSLPKPNTQADFAHQLDVEQGTVSRWERGTLAPSRETIEKISTLTKLPPEYIAYGVRADNTPFSHANAVINKETLKAAIETLEVALQNKHSKMTAEKKAEVILLIYDILAEEQTGASAKNMQKLLAVIDI